MKKTLRISSTKREQSSLSGSRSYWISFSEWWSGSGSESTYTSTSNELYASIRCIGEKWYKKLYCIDK